MLIGVSVRCPGDALEPILISGGFIGGFIGSLLPPEIAGDDAMKVSVIFGMVGLFTSCFRFPLTPVVLVLELTGIQTYTIIIPTALASFTALMVSNRLFPPLLTQILEQDGIDLEAIAEETAELPRQDLVCAGSAHDSASSGGGDESEDDASDPSGHPEPQPADNRFRRTSTMQSLQFLVDMLEESLGDARPVLPQPVSAIAPTALSPLSSSLQTGPRPSRRHSEGLLQIPLRQIVGWSSQRSSNASQNSTRHGRSME
ncbi:unnamed protein product, partial [Polarella glacialis]